MRYERSTNKTYTHIGDTSNKSLLTQEYHGHENQGSLNDYNDIVIKEIKCVINSQEEKRLLYIKQNRECNEKFILEMNIDSTEKYQRFYHFIKHRINQKKTMLNHSYVGIFMAMLDEFLVRLEYDKKVIVDKNELLPLFSDFFEKKIFF